MNIKKTNTLKCCRMLFILSLFFGVKFNFLAMESLECCSESRAVECHCTTSLLVVREQGGNLC